MKTVTAEYYDHVQDATVSVQLPAHYVVCDECAGEGRSSVHLGAFSMTELDEDPEFKEAYFAGAYDRPCPCCKGQRVVLRIDEEQCRADKQLRKILRRVEEWAQAAADCAAETAHERRMLGCH